jgi:hypothetical protein
MEINKEIIKILDKIIINKYNYITRSYLLRETKKYKRVYTNEYYLLNIFEMLNDINKWETLKNI